MYLFLGLLVGLMGLGQVACIPAFRGLKPVTQAELKPKKPRGDAEILYLDVYSRWLYGQVGQAPLTAFTRAAWRMRINNRKGLRALKRSFFGRKLVGLKVRSTCPDGRVTHLSLDDLKKLAATTGYTNEIHAMDPNLMQRGQMGSYKLMVPGVDVGCILDFMSELDGFGSISGSPNGAQMVRILRTFPIRKGHFQLEYRPLVTVRASLRYMDGIWHLIRKQHAKLNAGKDGKKTPLLLTAAEKKKYIRLRHKPGRVDLWLNNIPAGPRRQDIRKWAFRAYSLRLPKSYNTPPGLFLEIVSTHGIVPRDYLSAWKDIDSNFTEGRSWFWDDRPARRRNFQIDENEELDDSKGSLPSIARKLTRGATQRVTKIRTIYTHLRKRMKLQRRWQGLSSSRKLELVYALRRGSRYEINMIFVVMLRAVGVRAYPALAAAHDRGYHQLAPHLPFRTALVYVAPHKEGKWLGIRAERERAQKLLNARPKGYQGGRKVKAGQVLDPANKFLNYGILDEKYQDLYVFVIDGAGGRFFKTAAAKAEDNVNKQILKVNIKKDGTVTGTLTRHLRGNPAAKARAAFHNVRKHLWLEKRVGLGFRHGCLQQAKVSFAKKPVLSTSLKREFSFAHAFTSTSCVTHGKHGFLISNPFPWFLTLPRLLSKTRTAPIELGAPGIQEYVIEYTFPKGYKPRVPSASVKLSGPNLEGVLEAKKQGSTVRIRVRLKNTQRLYMPSSYAKIQGFYKPLLLLRRNLVVTR